MKCSRTYEKRFARLVNAFDEQIRTECANFASRRLGFDDLYATALVGLFFADHTFCGTHCNTEVYEAHVVTTVRQALDIFRKNSFFPRNQRSFFEDVGCGSHQPSMISMLSAPTYDLDLQLTIKDFLRVLPTPHRAVALDLYEGISLEEIASLHGMSDCQCNALQMELRRYWRLVT